MAFCSTKVCIKINQPEVEAIFREVYIILIAQSEYNMGKYFMSTQNIFTSRRRVKIWRESKISFPYCTTSVISDLLLL